MKLDTGTESYVSVENPAVANNIRSQRIIAIGDIPYDSQTNMPIGKSHYSVLASMCNEAGVPLGSLGTGNVLNFYPKKIAGRRTVAAGQVPKDSLEFKESFRTLVNEIMASGAKAVLLMGDYALKAFKPDADQIDNERGSPFYSKHLPGVICLPTYHPRDLFIRWHLNVLAQHDLCKVFRLAEDGWQPPKLDICYLPDFKTVILTLESFIENETYLSTDLETYGQGPKISCIGLAYAADKAIVIPFVNEKWEPYWSLQEEVAIWKKLRVVLTKNHHVGQYAVHYDTVVLANLYGIDANFVDDTMFAAWETYPEMQKSLGFLCSLYTDFEYHKDLLGKARRRQIPWYEEFRYCGIDCCACYQVAFALAKELKSRPKESAIHYRFNIKLSRPYNYMGLRGARLDKDKLEQRLIDLEAEVDMQQEFLNSEVGHEINVNSPKQMKEWMYVEKKYPRRQKPVKFSDGTKGYRDTSDYLTVLYMAREYGDSVLLRAGNLRKLKKHLSSLSSYLPRDVDGRMGWAFNVVGTETGRSTGYKPIDKRGVQPQNIDRNDRDLFLCDDEYAWLKVDLEGADSWTVAAQLCAFGEQNLLHDLQNGIKPAQVLALALTHGPGAIGWDVEKIQREIPSLETEKGKKLYAIAKAINHGSAYMLGKRGMHLNIFKQSDGDLYIPADECEKYQNLLFKRYPYDTLHDAMRSRMLSDAKLDSASGSVRHFFGRTDDNTLREMLAHIPQANTTFVNSVLLYRLYYEPLNRRPDGTFWLEMINQVHDEIDFQFRLADIDKCREVLTSSWTVPIECWGTPFTMGYEANYGPDWGACKTPLT
jgi:hypothetical protein